MANMRAKMVINRVEHYEGSDKLYFSAVCPNNFDSEGLDEDNTYAKYTPSADLQMLITNPALLGKFKASEVFYIDFTKVE